MFEDDWQARGAYDYIDDLNSAAYAWELLRRHDALMSAVNHVDVRTHPLRETASKKVGRARVETGSVGRR
jgi:hypothetical protein